MDDSTGLVLQHSIPTVTFFAVAAALLLVGRAIHLLYFHPLRSYPGPLLWRITSIPLCYHVFSGTAAQQYRRLHLKYGPVVRLGPNELSFADPQAWKDVHGARNPEFPKDLARGAMPPNGHYSITMSPKEDHARFRRLLAHAFSDQGLREQQPKIREYTDLMIDRLLEVARSGEVTNMADWFTITAFDIIGELAWGESFHGLENRRVHEWIPAIDGNLKYIVQAGIMAKVGLKFLNKYLVDEETVELRKKNFLLSAQMAEKRAEYMGPPRGDFWDRVMIKSANDNVGGEGMVKEEMANNASVLVLAGADTSATTLTGVTYLLLKHPKVTKKLTAEIRSAFKTSSEIDVYSVAQLKYLLAVLEEGMRLYPAVPAQTARTTPTGGGIVCGKWIPEGTSIQVPQVAMHTMPFNFHRSDEFLPERWLPDAPAEFHNDQKAAFQPFVVGSRNCIGRNLAYAEMRLTLAKVLFTFDLELDEERTKKHWLDETAFITWNKSALWVKLRAVAA